MNDYFPTHFATCIAKQHKLYTNKRIPAHRYPEDNPVWLLGKKEGRQDERLKLFQCVSLSQPFDECLNIYVDVKLSKKQRKALKDIHRMTPLWLKGELITKMYASIDEYRNTYGETKNLIRQSKAILKMLGMVNDN